MSVERKLNALERLEAEIAGGARCRFEVPGSRGAQPRKKANVKVVLIYSKYCANRDRGMADMQTGADDLQTAHSESDSRPHLPPPLVRPVRLPPQ